MDSAAGPEGGSCGVARRWRHVKPLRGSSAWLRPFGRPAAVHVLRQMRTPLLANTSMPRGQSTSPTRDDTAGGASHGLPSTNRIAARRNQAAGSALRLAASTCFDCFGPSRHLCSRTTTCSRGRRPWRKMGRRDDIEHREGDGQARKAQFVLQRRMAPVLRAGAEAESESDTQHVEAPPPPGHDDAERGRASHVLRAGEAVHLQAGPRYGGHRVAERGSLTSTRSAANQKTRHWPDGDTKCLQGHRTPAGAPVIPRFDNPMA